MTSQNFFGITPYGALPSARQIQHYKMGKKAMICFGVNTFTDSEWGSGKEDECIFDPYDLDIRSWIRDLKCAGFRLVILTAKHHDGFCLWPSRYSEHTIAKSPYQDGMGDLVREFTDACHEYNMKVGLYLSPWDRNSRYWGTDEYNTFYANQLTELLTQYGTIDEIWWDGAGSTEAHYDFGRWAYLIRNLQPNAVIFGTMGATPYTEMRWVGNEAGRAGETHYASIDRASMEAEDTDALNAGKIGAELYIPAEVDVSIRPGWFYHEDQNAQVKDSRILDEIWFRSTASNAIMLLSFAPDVTGSIRRDDVRQAVISHHRISRMLSVNYLECARVSADPAYCPETDIEKAIFPDTDLFYAGSADLDQVEIDIHLDGQNTINTLMLGEKIELGERITSFTLESLDGETPSVLTCGTSVGYLKGKRFAAGAYRHLRLTLRGIAAPLTLQTLGLHFYEEQPPLDVSDAEKPNLADLPSTDCILSRDGHIAVFRFSGIYPFDTVSFEAKVGASYEFFAFDGFKFTSVCKGIAEDSQVTIHLDKPIDTAYQVKFVCESGFNELSNFLIS